MQFAYSCIRMSAQYVMQLVQMQLSAHTYIRIRNVRSTLVRLQLFLVHNIQAHIVLGILILTCIRMKEQIRWQVRHQTRSKVLLWLKITQIHWAQCSLTGNEKCLFSLANCTLCDSCAAAGGDNL